MRSFNRRMAVVRHHLHPFCYHITAQICWCDLITYFVCKLDFRR